MAVAGEFDVGGVGAVGGGEGEMDEAGGVAWLVGGGAFHGGEADVGVEGGSGVRRHGDGGLGASRGDAGRQGEDAPLHFGKKKSTQSASGPSMPVGWKAMVVHWNSFWSLKFQSVVAKLLQRAGLWAVEAKIG